MNLAATAFWREMSIAVTLALLATASFVSAKDIVLDDTYTVLEAATNERLRLICDLKTPSQLPSVQWYKDGQLVDGLSKRIKLQRHWLRIKGFRAKDAGVYSCTNEEERFNELSVTINLKEPDQDIAGYQAEVDIERPLPEILAQHEAASLVENDTIEEIEKRFSNNVMFKDYHNKHEDAEDKEKEHTNYGHVNNTMTKFAPRFTHRSKMFNMDMRSAGNSVRLRCAAEGNPAPNITWYKNKVTPINRSYFQPSYGKWSLSLEELTMADNGNYTCVVCNELGCIEHTVVLHVQERYPSKPYIKEGYPGNITVLVNESVQLSCPAVSDLEPFIYWIRPSNYSLKDAEVRSSDMPIPVGDVIESENNTDKPEQLTIYNVTKEDEGWYACVALNTLGNSTAKGYLTVLELQVSTTKPTTTTTSCMDNGKHTAFMNVVTAVLGAMFFIAAIIVVMMFKKLKREKIKKQLAIEEARTALPY